MMKNSKLSKLLVAGVSVAMLTSAFAPMAFAEESGTNGAVAGTPLNVYIVVKNSNGNVTGLNQTNLPKINGIEAEADTYSDQGSIGHYTFNVNVEDDEFVGSNGKDLVVGDLSLNGFKTKDWGYKDEFNSNLTSKALTSTITMKELWEESKKSVGADAVIVLTVVETPYAKIQAPDTLTESVKSSFTDPTIAKIGDKEIAADSKIYMDDVVKLPTYTTNGTDKKYSSKGIEVVVKKGATVVGKKTVPMGGTFKLSDSEFGLTEYIAGWNSNDNEAVATDITVKYTAKFTDVTPGKVTVEKVTLNGNTDYKVVKKNSTTGKLDDVTSADAHNALEAKITGVDAKNVGLLDEVKRAAHTVEAGKSLSLPALQIMTDDTPAKVDGDYTFLYWQVGTTDAVLADGVTKAKDYVIKNNTFVASDFKIDATDAGALKLIPVFEYAAVPSTEKYTTDPLFKTPNDKVDVYNEKGVRVLNDATYDEYLQLIDEDAEFEGGLFYNEVDKVLVMYQDEKDMNGKWNIDTTVNGIADGIYFENGVQDTKAYGLKKVVGDDSAFVYLVSDGVYQADYNGMWEDEDGSVYKLEKGCTNTTFTGVYDRGDWALSVKDSKVQKDETGFVLYGDKQYWFINGICNMKETEAVRQHTDGNFYYTVGAKIDFTFNGECNGHTFVNGVASK